VTSKTKAQQTKADRAACLRLWSKIVRSVGVCAHCGGTEKLNAHHIIKRRQSVYLSVDLRNGLCLCAKCHMGWWHYDEVRAARWLYERKGGWAFWGQLDRDRHLPARPWAETRKELEWIASALPATGDPT